MKLKKDTLYTIIDTDFEKLHIYPDSGYTVWQTYDPQSNRDWWCAIPTNHIFNDIEPFIVSVDDDGNAELELDDMGDSLTSFLSWNLEHHEYDDVAIIHDESNDPYAAYYVDKDEVGEGGYQKAGYHLHLRGEDEDIVTSEEVCCYYLGGTEEYTEGTMYFKDGFSQPPISINDLFVDFD